MKVDGEEKRIRRLFSEMSSADERLAPEFASVLESVGALARAKTSRTFRTALALSMACAALILLWVTVARHPTIQPTVEPDDQVSASQTSPEPAPDGRVQVAPPVKRVVKRVRHRRSPNELTIAIERLLAWQSPTASLLKSPNDELLKSVPRLGESLQVVQSLSPDRLN